MTINQGYEIVVGLEVHAQTSYKQQIILRR